MYSFDDSNNLTIDEYCLILDNYEIELSEDEQKDIEELNRLLNDHQTQKDLSTEIWDTIKKATIDSVEEIIGLSDRGDWRPDQGAVITTPLNFRKGIVASEADHKRYQMWQDRLNGNAPSASDFRDNNARFISSFTSSKRVFKDSKRNPDGSYNSDYNHTIVYGQNDPRTYRDADASGDMIRDTTKTMNVDHINSVRANYEDDTVALYGGSTEEGFEKTMCRVTNNQSNYAISDEHANKAMKDKDTLETAKNQPDLNMHPEMVKAKQEEADRAKKACLLKEAIGEKSKELAIGVGKSTLAATGKMLIGKTLKIAVSETVIEFQQKSEEKLIDRVKRVIHKIIQRAKEELSHIWKEFTNFAVKNAISEIVNIIINYFVSTVKNVFKLIRCLIGSIIQAFKIIFDNSQPWEDRLFEALKIISAGIAMASGAMLNELIADLIATNIPFLAGFATDISAVVSGLISSILSALVLMSFDRYKASLKFDNEERRIQLLNMQLVGGNVSHSMISTAKTSLIVAQTAELVRQEMVSIYKHNQEINTYLHYIRENNLQIREINNKIDYLQQDGCNMAKLEKIRKAGNNNIDNKLNNLPSLDNEE